MPSLPNNLSNKLAVVQSFATLGQRLAALCQPEQPLLVAVDGRAGAGKSLFANNLACAFKQIGQTCHIIHFDEFWMASKTQSIFSQNSQLAASHDYGYDWRRFREQLLIPLQKNHSAKFQQYDRETKTLTAWKEVPANGIVIIEGFSSTRRELASYYDFRVFVQAPQPTRLVRVTRRGDKELHGWYKIFWLPEEEHYMQTHSPEAATDLIVDTSGSQDYDQKSEYVCLLT